jgi:hypothetical protein
MRHPVRQVFAGGAGDSYFGRRKVCELRGRRKQVKLSVLSPIIPR